MADSFDSKRLKRAIARLDDVRAQAKVIREQVARELDRNRVTDKVVRPVRQRPPRGGAGRRPR